MSVIGALASLLRGTRYVHVDEDVAPSDDRSVGARVAA